MQSTTQESKDCATIMPQEAGGGGVTRTLM